MKTIYKGHEIDVHRDRSLGGDDHLYYSIMRLEDGYECTSSFTSAAETVRGFTKHMKDRIDAELASEDPWGEAALAREWGA